MLIRSLIPAVLSGLIAACGTAMAGTKDDVRDLQARMEVVEQATAAHSAATVRISELERQIQLLTGQIEQLSYELERAHQRLDAVSAALAGDSLGVQTGFDGAGGGFDQSRDAARGPVNLSAGDPIADQIDQTNGRAGGPDAQAASAPQISMPLDADAAFDYAFGFLLAGDYQRAKAAFELYLEAFPNYARTADAQFRLGEIHLALGENSMAADAFIKHIRNYPNDPRAAEAYLKWGTAFARLEKPQEACTVFKTMRSKFPDAAAPVAQRAELEMARIDCK